MVIIIGLTITTILKLVTPSTRPLIYSIIPVPLRSSQAPFGIACRRPRRGGSSAEQPKKSDG